MTALHCAVLAHNAVLHELQNCQPPHSPEVQELLLRNKSLVETIKTLIQMGASVEAKVSKTAFCKVSDPKKIGKQIMSLYPMPHLSPLITEEVD